jgi:hypothetical protein
MSEVTIVLDPTETPAIRCFEKNAHVALKLGALTLIFAANLLPTIQAEISKCLKKSGKKSKA